MFEYESLAKSNAAYLAELEAKRAMAGDYAEFLRGSDLVFNTGRNPVELLAERRGVCRPRCPLTMIEFLPEHVVSLPSSPPLGAAGNGGA